MIETSDSQKEGSEPGPDNPNLQTPNLKPSGFHRRRLRGKVARLPLPVRNIVNEALRDGVSYIEVISLLAARGFSSFTKSHIAIWVKRGHRDWLLQQERFEQSQGNIERLAALLGRLRDDGRCELSDLNEWLLAAQVNKALTALDDTALAKVLADKPDEFFRLARIVVSHGATRALRQQAEIETLKYELVMRKNREREQRKLQPKGVTSEEMARIHAKVNLM